MVLLDDFRKDPSSYTKQDALELFTMLFGGDSPKLRPTEEIYNMFINTPLLPYYEELDTRHMLGASRQDYQKYLRQNLKKFVYTPDNLIASILHNHEKIAKPSQRQERTLRQLYANPYGPPPVLHRYYPRHPHQDQATKNAAMRMKSPRSPSKYNKFVKKHMSDKSLSHLSPTEKMKKIAKMWHNTKK